MKTIFTIAALAALTGSAMAQQNRNFFDANGNLVGRSDTNRTTGRTEYFDGNNNAVGSAVPAGPRTYYYDRNGNAVGASQE